MEIIIDGKELDVDATLTGITKEIARLEYEVKLYEDMKQKNIENLRKSDNDIAKQVLEILEKDNTTKEEIEGMLEKLEQLGEENKKELEKIIDNEGDIVQNILEFK